jgi:PAS domain S-box-containing protein
VFGIPATIALFLLTLTALRRTRSEALAHAQAKDEMQRREAAEEDVLTRKRIEAALRESEERLRLILESLPDIAFVQRPDGTAEYHNRRFYDFVGPTASNDMAARLGFHHPDDVPTIMAVRENARAVGAEYSYEARLRRHDGSYRWHTVTCKPLHRDGKIIAWLGSAVDIDDIHRANELLESRVKERTRELAEANDHLVREMAERQAAEQALRLSEKLTAIGQLTGGVAHDFNNVLTAVLGNLELVERHLKDDRAKRMVQSATRAAMRGAKLTEQLLAYARKQRLVPQAIDLNQMLGRETVDMLRRTLGGTVTVETDLAPNLWMALMDPTQIELVVLNLAINARDAMPEGAGGRIIISTRNVPRGDPDRPADLVAGDYVMFAVADNGSGMPEEVAAKAFEPFFTTKAPGKGSGLGLSQVYGVTQQLGGGVRLKTRPGDGTTIEVFLPRTDAVPAAPSRDETVSSPGRRATILVVDDEDDVRDVAVAHLEALGYRTLTAANGAAALEMIAADKSIDLMLADYAMPGMIGTDLARVALATRPDLPIVLVTGHADFTKIDQQVTGVIVIKKPYRQSELAGRIEAVLARRALRHGDLVSEAGQ